MQCSKIPVNRKEMHLNTVMLLSIHTVISRMTLTIRNSICNFQSKKKKKKSFKVNLKEQEQAEKKHKNQI
jgi:hypothetical protein